MSLMPAKVWKDWLKSGTFYVHGFVYMLVRVAVNVTMTVQPFYLEKALNFKGKGGSHMNRCQYSFKYYQVTDVAPTPF